jgi:hypothetical protein
VRLLSHSGHPTRCPLIAARALGQPTLIRAPERLLQEPLRRALTRQGLVRLTPRCRHPPIRGGSMLSWTCALPSRQHCTLAQDGLPRCLAMMSVKVAAVVCVVLASACTRPSSEDRPADKRSASPECFEDRSKILEAARTIVEIGKVADSQQWGLPKMMGTIRDLQLARTVAPSPELNYNLARISDCGKEALAAFVEFERALVHGVTNKNSADYKAYSLKDQGILDDADQERMKSARVKLDQKLAEMQAR